MVILVIVWQDSISVILLFEEYTLYIEKQEEDIFHDDFEIKYKT